MISMLDVVTYRRLAADIRIRKVATKVDLPARGLRSLLFFATTSVAAQPSQSQQGYRKIAAARFLAWP
ncbi:hypothetical protein BFX40_27840 [Mesorhizobium sp. SEMIA 3007]|nr:hypothetical protein A9174_16060 [Mesorhizobium loti NZP2037]ODA96297.1 hypothetical protein BFX40_27840 [Mesorhizobium sp. SEMIA 3007]